MVATCTFNEAYTTMALHLGMNEKYETWTFC